MLCNPPTPTLTPGASKRTMSNQAWRRKGHVVIVVFYPVAGVALVTRNPDKMAAADCSCQVLSVRFDHWSFSLGEPSSSSFLYPIKAILFTSSEWLQVCPWKHLAQIEQVAALVCLFKTHRLGIMKVYYGDSDRTVR